ncbi:MAG: glycosyltransferase family 2 protein [Alphaproteobacteria bacterium]|nr:glycosyltransferase family 2 protein [Alphaproteobacteria bacterium]
MTGSPELSVVVPVKDEVENAVPLLNEICAALRGKASFEVLFIDDGSSDGTVGALVAARATTPELRVLRHAKNSGQSRAVRSGVIAARGSLIATLDGDGQNDPADIPNLLAVWRREAAGTPELGLVAGQRRKREDNFMKRMASRVGNGTRQWLLQDGTRDTGCGLKLFSRTAFLSLPYFDHIHRFIPALMLREGYRITHVDVHHRPRSHGQSKYGTLDRLLVSLSDLMGVRWLRRRARNPVRVDEV